MDEFKTILELVSNQGFPLVLSVLGLYGLFRLLWLAVKEGLVPLLQAKAAVARAAEHTIETEVPRLRILLEELRELMNGAMKELREAVRG